MNERFRLWVLPPLVYLAEFLLFILACCLLSLVMEGNVEYNWILLFPFIVSILTLFLIPLTAIYFMWHSSDRIDSLKCRFVYSIYLCGLASIISLLMGIFLIWLPIQILWILIYLITRFFVSQLRKP